MNKANCEHFITNFNKYFSQNPFLCRLGSVVNDSSRGLLRKLEESFEKALDLNDKKIKLKCGEVQSHAEVKNVVHFVIIKL